MMATLIGLLVGIIIIVLFWIFIRASYAFKGIFGVFPKQATQEMVNEKILELQNVLAHENEKVPVQSSMDEDVAGCIESKLERAKKLAQKYSFTIPEWDRNEKLEI